MQYYVTIAGREIPVEITGGRVKVQDRDLVAELDPAQGRTLRHLVTETGSLPLVLEGGAGRWSMEHRGTRYEVEVVDERTRQIRKLAPPRGTGGGGGELRAPMPGLVVRVLVKPGEAVEAGQGVLILEAMKMENELRAGCRGVVGSLAASPGQVVERGQVLATISVHGGGPGS